MPVAHLSAVHTLVGRCAAPRPARRTRPRAALVRRLVTPVRAVEVGVAEVGGVYAVAREAAELVRGTRAVLAVCFVRGRGVAAVVVAVAHLASVDAFGRVGAFLYTL